jgi:beta-lactam-binding protein with PASTA domain
MERPVAKGGLPMPQDEFQIRIKKLESDLLAAQRRIVVQEADLTAKNQALAEKEKQFKALEANQRKLDEEINILRKKVTGLTSEKEQLAQKVDQLKMQRVKPTPNELIQSFRLAMDQLQKSLAPKPGERVGYNVSQFDVDLKTTVAVDKEDQTVRLLLPEPGEEIPGEMLSNVRFTFSAVPKVEPSDPDLVEVPMLLGLSKQIAAVRLAERGLKVGNQTEQDSLDPPGNVIGQNPDGGDLVLPESAVDITIAKDPYVLVPQLEGKTFKQAQALIKKAGLAVGSVEEKTSTAPAGSVIVQDPEADLKVLRESEVNLVLAVQEMIEVPGITGMMVDDAKKKILGKRLAVGSVYSKESSKPVGTVLEQVPNKSTKVPPGSAVSLVVGISDKVEVPVLLKRKLTEAKKMISKAELSLGKITPKIHQKLDGLILEQKPAGGTAVKKKTAINLTVAQKVVIRNVLNAMKDHIDIGKTGVSHRTLVKKFSAAGIDSVAEVEKLQKLSNAQLRTQLNLPTAVGAKFVKRIIRDVIKGALKKF